MYFASCLCRAAGLFAFWLYRRRKTESYEHAIAFAPLKGILEAAMAVPFGIAVGMIISRVAANKGLFLFGGCIVGCPCRTCGDPPDLPMRVKNHIGWKACRNFQYSGSGFDPCRFSV